MTDAPRIRRNPTRASLGIASLSISSLFVISSGDKPECPVTLPPGRARLATKPASTGSTDVRHHDGDGTWLLSSPLMALASLRPRLDQS